MNPEREAEYATVDEEWRREQELKARRKRFRRQWIRDVTKNAVGNAVGNLMAALVIGVIAVLTGWLKVPMPTLVVALIVLFLIIIGLAYYVKIDWGPPSQALRRLDLEVDMYRDFSRWRQEEAEKREMQKAPRKQEKGSNEDGNGTEATTA